MKKFVLKAVAFTVAYFIAIGCGGGGDISSVCYKPSKIDFGDRVRELNYKDNKVSNYIEKIYKDTNGNLSAEIKGVYTYKDGILQKVEENETIYRNNRTEVLKTTCVYKNDGVNITERNCTGEEDGLTKYTYKDGNIEKEFWNNDTQMSKYYYDNNNNLIKEEYYDKNSSGDFVLFEKTEYTYNNNNELIKEELFSQDGRLLNRVEYKYNNKGDLVEDSFYKYTLEYDENDNITSIKRVKKSDNTSVKTTKIEWIKLNNCRTYKHYNNKNPKPDPIGYPYF